MPIGLQRCQIKEMYVNLFTRPPSYNNVTNNHLDVPHMFQLNYKSPPFSYQAEAASALVFGTGLAVGGFSMLLFGSCWIWDISTIPEFSLKAKGLMGQELTSDEALTKMPLDDDTAKVVGQIEKLLKGNSNDKS